MFSRVAEQLSHRLMHRKGWQGGNKTLRQSDLFIMPNRYGLYVAFLVFASFGLGYKVQNNFILIGVIFLFLLFMLSLISAVRNLQGTSISLRPEARNFAQQTAYVTCRLKKESAAYNIRLFGVLGTPKGIELDLSSSQAFYRLPVLLAERGRHAVPPLKLQTRFPFGIVRCWSWLAPPVEMLIAPVPTEHPLTSYPRLDRMRLAQMDQPQGTRDEIEDYQDPRPFQDGDLPSRIDWKRFAATREALVRDFESSSEGDVYLEAANGMAREEALSYLCGGLKVCERAGVNVVMALDEDIHFISTRQQFDEAFHVLACA
ncbi:MAG: DUF58 domain-containing protein [Parvibaculales bacterium]